MTATKNRLVRADALMNIGDCYTRLRDFSSARVAYLQALRLDQDTNYRAIKSLGGT